MTDPIIYFVPQGSLTLDLAACRFRPLMAFASADGGPVALLRGVWDDLAAARRRGGTAWANAHHPDLWPHDVRDHRNGWEWGEIEVPLVGGDSMTIGYRWLKGVK